MRSWAQTQLAISRWILRVLGLLAGVSVAASAALLHYIVLTPEGLQFVVNHFPQHIGSVTLELSGVTGTLGKEVRIERLEIDHERVHLQLADLHGSIALPALLHQSLTVPDFGVRLLTITMKPRLHPARPETVPFLPRWMVIRAHRATVSTLTVNLASGRTVRMTHLGGAGVVRPRTIDFLDSYGTLGALTARAKGQLGAGDPLLLRSDGDVTIHFVGQPDWHVQASVNGDLSKMPFKGLIDVPMRATFAGNAYDLTNAWHWTSESDIQEFTLLPWNGGNLLGVITGHVSAEGDSKAFGGHGPLDSAGLHVGLFDSVFHGSYANGILSADRMEVTHRSSGAHASGTGTIAVVTHGPRLDLHGSWTNFRWPLAGADAAARSAGGDFHLSGVWPYAVESSGTMSIPLLPWFTDVPVQMTGALDHDHLDIDQAMVAAISGATEVNGKAYWSPEPHWIAAGTSTGIDAALIRSDVPGRLNLAFDARGNGFDITQDFDVNLHSMGGTLRKVAARGEGKFGRHHGDWSFDRVLANLGGTNIALDGKAGASLDLRFTLASDDLSLLGVGATGKLSARGSVGGSFKSPHVELAASGAKITYAGALLQSLQANIDIDAARSSASSARIALRDLSYGKRTLDSLTLALDGTAQQHGIDLKMDALNLHGEARAAGAFTDGVWRGELQNMELKGSDALNLSLEKTVALLASTEAVRVDPFCLSGLPAHLCADADWTRAKWSTHLSASDLPMSALTSGQPQNISYQGTISLAAEGFGGAGVAPQGQIRAELADAQLLHREANRRVTVTTLGSGYVLVQAKADTINAEVSLDAGEVGTIKGRATAQRDAPTLADMPVQGTLQARTAELGFITLYAPEIDRAGGNLSADLEVSGTLGEPRLNGAVKLTNAELNLYQVNFSMHQTSLEARLTNNLLDFTGGAQIGAGHVGARGHLEWHDSLPHGRIELNGESLRVADIPEAQIDASPSLVFAIDGRRIDVTGRVNVPFAHIQPADLTGAVRSSSDEVIVGADAPESGPPFDVTSDITLALGDKVSIETSGLTGRLTGNIELRTGTDNVTRGTGELQINEGKYAAYGRKLDIQKGRLIFTGGTVADPGVDIRAVKQFPENVAGVNVRGTLLQPRLSFFSEPSLPQSQIVSLILAGGSFSGEDSTIVSPTHVATGTGSERTGNELLAQGGAILAQQLGAQLGLSSRLGIEDVTIESDLNNDTALVLGRYLSPRLYVSYGISLTEAINTVKLRYSLNDHWTVRTEVGGEHSAELVYTIEK